MNEHIEFHHQAQLVTAEISHQPTLNHLDRYVVTIPKEWEKDLGDTIEFELMDREWITNKRLKLIHPETWESLRTAFAAYLKGGEFF